MQTIPGGHSDLAAAAAFAVANTASWFLLRVWHHSMSEEGFWEGFPHRDTGVHIWLCKSRDIRRGRDSVVWWLIGKPSSQNSSAPLWENLAKLDYLRKYTVPFAGNKQTFPDVLGQSIAPLRTYSGHFPYAARRYNIRDDWAGSGRKRFSMTSSYLTFYEVDGWWGSVFVPLLPWDALSTRAIGRTDSSWGLLSTALHERSGIASPLALLSPVLLLSAAFRPFFRTLTGSITPRPASLWQSYMRQVTYDSSPSFSIAMRNYPQPFHHRRF
ncbi:uncharacterized protein CLUP02_08114 [Colletotrichum lupini]|uniref:Uncharacterized protein n=1 Tax=Colletotrichum lupini TaxID=145971 RepID=A0A9Q8SSA5_9PEZI|nr:uncharacterized protein CLUP02_08114 [Colletotrichum lupini]UQC82624.1 hypothetical protein CLUP02_08114 [Colletotrichum lupini]